MRQIGYDMLRCVALSYMDDAVHFCRRSTSHVHILVLEMSVLKADGPQTQLVSPFYPAVGPGECVALG